MYEFIDTNEISAGVLLPAEALQINGEYIENLIDGYRTLSVEGREALSPELATYETGAKDGAGLKNKRYPARTIIVKYQLIAKSSEAFREAYNKLASILNVENAELIFNDEQDKYFIGTPSAIGSVEPGKNAVIGEFELLCVDPFKYSVFEYEAAPNLDEKSIIIDYKGTYKSYPTLEADFYSNETNGANGSGDCGYVAFFNESEKIIQLGDPEEENIGNYAKSQTLINPYFKSLDAWNDITESEWALNSGYVIPSSIKQIGSVGIVPASYEATPSDITNATILSVRSTSELPYIDYKIVVKTSERRKETVTVVASITAALAKSNNYFGKKRGIKGSLQIAGEWHEVTIKKESDYWRGNSAHTVTIKTVIEGLEESDTVLKDIKFKAERTDDLGKTGVLSETKCADIPISRYYERIPETYCLGALNYGASYTGWHGATITRELPADAAGEIGAANFSLTVAPRFSADEKKEGIEQLGGLQIQAVTADGKVVAGVRLLKDTTGRKFKSVIYCAGYQSTSTVSFSNVNAISITKTGGKIVLRVGNAQKTFSGNGLTFTQAELAAAKVTKITLSFEQYGDKPAMTYNGIYWLKFVKNNCTTYKEIPNKFSTNDVVIADCGSGEVALNGVPSPELGALGNDWEEFYLTPGINQIGFAYSDWVEAGGEPTFKIRYREVYL